MQARRSRWLVALALVWIAACRSDPDSARGVAERFLDQRYVLIDAAAAADLSTGVARRKLEAERRLTVGHSIDATTLKPTVRYKLLETKGSDEQPAFVFEGTIYSDGDDSFTRKWLISTRREGSAWRVSNFEEFE